MSRIIRCEACGCLVNKTFGHECPGSYAPVGLKLDAGKPRFSLLPFDAVSRVVDVLEYGAAKYSVNGWTKVEHADDRYFDAALRHLVAWRGGERLDEESGLPHLAHATACLLFLLALGERA